ncbi:MAG: rhomboid family intramembrane serine protease [Traorella sp.]
MAEKQVYGLQMLTFLVNKYDYQIVNIKGLKTQDYWLVNLNQKYPLICITNDLYTQNTIHQGSFGQIYSAIISTFRQNTKCLILNTNQLSQKFEINQVIQIPLIEDKPLDDELKHDFSGIEDVVHKVYDVNKEKRSLTKILQQKEKSRYQSVLKQSRKNMKVTNIMVIICILMYFLCQLLSLINDNPITSAIVLGAYYKINVIGAFEYWRLLVSGFIHISFFHLLMNMLAFFNLGMVLEKQMKRSQYIIVLLVSIVVGNLFVLMGSSNIVGVGISGGLYGLLGVYTVMIFSSGAYKNRAVLSSFISVLTVNILISLMPNISLLAHLGGFISGVVLGVYYSTSVKLKDIKKHVLIPYLFVIIGCFAWIPKVSRISPIYAGTDANIIYTLEELHLDPYADYLIDRYDAHLSAQGEEGYKFYLKQLVSTQREEYNEKK